MIDSKEFSKSCPLTWNYLQENRARLSTRNKGFMGRDWYGYVYKKNHTRFETSKLLVPSIATGSSFTADIEGKYYFVGSGGGGGGGYGIVLLENQKISPLYLLGLLNSNLVSDHLRKIATTFRGGYVALNKQYVDQLPIRLIDFTASADKARHDRMVMLVEQMLSLNKQLSAAKTDHEKTFVQRQIDATDTQIDRLVYELYELSDEEIRIVEDV